MSIFSRLTSPAPGADLFATDPDPCLHIAGTGVRANPAATAFWGPLESLDDLNAALPADLMTAIRGVLRDGTGQAMFDPITLKGRPCRVLCFAAKDHGVLLRISPWGEETLVAQDVAAKVPAALWRQGADGRILWGNPAYTALFGLDLEEALQQQKKIPTGQNPRQHLVVGGQRRLFAVARLPLQAESQTLGYAVDITREEELEGDKNRAVAAMRELLEQLSTAVATFTADQKLEFFNSSFSQLWDLDDQWLNTPPKLGEIMERLREMRRLPEQADFKRFKQSWLDMFTKLIDPYEEMLHLPDGKSLRMLIVPNPAGGLMFTFEDVTSRLELETSYNTLVAVQRETLDNLAEGIAVFGGDGRLKLWNPAFARLWKLHPEDLDGDPHVTRLVEKFQDCFSQVDWPAVRDTLLAQALNGQEMLGQLLCEDGRQLSYSTVVLPDGGMLVSHIDITDTVRVEKALRDKNIALETAERLKLDFLANVSYQLRTPLNAIMGFTEILDHQYFGPLNDKQKQYTTGVREASERLLTLIDDILDLSTIEAGYMRLEYNDVVVSDLLVSLYDLTKGWAQKEGITVQIDLPEDPGVIEADARRIKQILLNLIRNAIDFTQSGGGITLGAVREGDRMKIIVTDTGIGIPPEEVTRIFSPFERGHAPVPETETGRRAQGLGVGLGLTLVKNITELHGGQVFVSSEFGKGTKVVIDLPIRARLGFVAADSPP